MTKQTTKSSWDTGFGAASGVVRVQVYGDSAIWMQVAAEKPARLAKTQMVGDVWWSAYHSLWAYIGTEVNEQVKVQVIEEL